jgi:outer membrane protein OmpA-like peptidoglycan-associated protein
MPTKWAQSFFFATIVGLAPSAAFAQTATALDRFEPAPAGDGSFAVPRASVLGHLNPTAALTLSYANAPLSLRTYDIASGKTLADAAVVDHQLVMHVLASIEIMRRVKIDFDVPFTISQGGSSPTVDSKLTTVPTPTPQSFVSPTGASMNDVRLGARIALVRQHGWIPAASLAYSVWFPSGNAQAYTGTGFVRHAPSLIFGAEQGRYAWSVMAGRRVQDSQNGAGLIGGEILGGASFAARFDKLTAHSELFGSVATADKSTIATTTPNLELLVGARYNFGPIVAGLMGGPGLLRGIGTPTFRILATISTNFGSVEPAKTAPTTAQTVRPAEQPTPTKDISAAKKIDLNAKKIIVLDRDGDTVADQDDVCPDTFGEASLTVSRRGCPSDRDGDLIADVDDRCPDEKGVATPDLARFGCPLDTDADGFADAVDACPNEKGEANEDATKVGCPRAVRVEGTQIVILQSVNFATGSDVINANSFTLLEQVAAVLAEHPEIVRVAVDGHTDNAGITKANITLSEKRSVSVVTWLVDHGIDARRLEARGFGPRRPIATNGTPEGKAKNRRVEFQILKRSTEGSSAWRAGTVQ